VAHTCNPNYLAGEIRRFEANQSVQKSLWDPISTKKMGMVVRTCHPSYMGSTNRKIMGAVLASYSKNS
jgi:hypothetical protein